MTIITKLILERYKNSTKQFKCIWDYRRYNAEKPEIDCSMLKKENTCNEGSMNYRLCQDDKFYIVSFPDSNKLLNKRLEFVSRCHHGRKYLLSNLAPD